MIRRNSEPATLTGLAIGDALGVPFETHPYMSELLTAWDGGFVDSQGLNTVQPERRAGEWSDDTKMAIGLAESLIQNNTYNPIAAAEKYLEWYLSGDHRGIGKSTKQALDRFVQGYHWNQAGVLHAQGNGTAMRVAPIGLYYRKSLLTVADMARIDARLTHRDIEAEEGSAAVALGVALLAEGLADKETVLSPILNLLHSDPGDTCITLLETRLATLQDALRAPEVDVSKLLKELVGKGAHVAFTVPAAFLCFISTESFREAVELAVRAGGDCDTTAAMTGALAGTYYGAEQVEPYLAELEQASYLQHLNHVIYLAAPNIPEDT